ncbi:MAG: acyltransferase [Colwellia sp.]|nr:acyltransferase [Colwellia sp.]
MEEKKRIRLHELDALRGLAAIAVVLFHYFYRYNEIYSHENLLIDWAQWGEHGVQLFFIISGFVIYWTLNRVAQPMDFIVSRFSRLYPVFWAALLLTFLTVLIFGLPGREVTVWEAIVNLIMVHEYLRIPHVDGVYWTLTVEITFYFYVFILYFFKQLKHVEVWLLPAIIVGVLKGVGVDVPNELSKILIADHMAFFVAGICFYKIQYEVFSKLTVGILIFSLTSSIAIFSGTLFVFFVAMYLVFYLAISSRLKFLTFRPFLFFGSISYAWYLVHQNIGYIIINGFYNNGLPPILGVGVAVITSIFLAYLLTILVEKPSMIFIRNFYSSIKARREQVVL